MEKIIWLINDNRKDLVDAQRKINSRGSMRAVCIFSHDALKRSIDGAGEESKPSLIVMDADTERKYPDMLATINREQALAGVPVFFMSEGQSPENDDECFSKGALAIVRKPMTEHGIKRIERMAWQYDATRNYERYMQKQIAELNSAKEIYRLNKQLENRNRFLNQIFGKYFPDDVVEEILNEPGGSMIGGKKKDVSVLISDLRGFSAIAEAVEPDKLMNMLNFYYTAMEEAIISEHGTIIEFMGDGILAVFGNMAEDENHCLKALRAAVKMQQAMAGVNEYMKSKALPRLEMGIGVDRGEAFVGNVGSEKMMRYNVIGRVVNRVARIEGCTTGGQIFASTDLLEMVSRVDKGDVQSLDVKGFHDSVNFCEIYAVNELVNHAFEEIEAVPLKKATDNFVLRLNRVDGKTIRDKYYFAKLLYANRVRIIIENEDMIPNLELFDDLHISVVDSKGKTICRDVYAKVTGLEGNQMTLRHTHSNSDYEAWLGIAIGEKT